MDFPEQAQLGFPQLTKTWEDASREWLARSASKAPETRRSDLRCVRWISARWIDKPIADVTAADVEDLVQLRLAEGVSPRTANRIVEVVRAVLRASAARGWLFRVPQLRTLPPRPRRVRWLTYGQARRLLDQLPPHLADLAGFALETGLRRSNCTQLRWDQVDLEEGLAWIHADQAKGRRGIAVPLSPTAVAILERRRTADTFSSWCFTYQGRPVRQTSTRAWYHALQRAGIEDFRWHDLRHTWASWHAQAGTPLHVLQELGGWRSPQMVQVYAHLSTAHLRAHVNRAHSWVRKKRRRR